MNANTVRMDMGGAFPQIPAPNGGKLTKTNSTQGHEEALLADAPIYVGSGPRNYPPPSRPRGYTNEIPTRSAAGMLCD